jgi:predicted O-methyltransferase YrrM
MNKADVLAKPFVLPEGDLSGYRLPPDSWQFKFQAYRTTCRNGVTGLLNPEDSVFLYHAARCLPVGGRAAEIGSFKGESSVHLAAGARRAGALPVFAIDPFRPNRGSETFDDYWSEFVRTIRVCGLEDFVVPLADYSQNVVDRFDDGELDLLFIDGDHSYEGVKRDYELYVSKVKPGGLILFHDATYGPVARFLSEIGGVVPVTELIAALFRPEGAQESDPK